MHGEGTVPAEMETVGAEAGLRRLTRGLRDPQEHPSPLGPSPAAGLCGGRGEPGIPHARPQLGQGPSGRRGDSQTRALPVGGDGAEELPALRPLELFSSAGHAPRGQ